MELVEIGGRTWAIGLEWYAITEGTGRRELARWATNLGGNHFALRNRNILQRGLGQGRFERPPRACALAPNIASALEPPWLGVFSLGGGRYWYVAIRQGLAILPDGDVVGTQAQVEKARVGGSDQGGWKRAHGDLAEIERLLGVAGWGRDARIRPVQVAVPWRQLAAVTSVTGALIASYSAYWHHQANLTAEQAWRVYRQRLAELADRRAPLPVAKPARELPWLDAPAPSEIAAACDQVFALTPMSVDGWVLADWYCGRDFWKASYVRARGATLLAAPAGTLDHAGNEIAQRGLVGARPDPAQLALPSREEGLRLLYGTAQAAGFSLSVQPPPRLQGPLPGSTDKSSLPAPWEEWKVTLTCPLPPLDTASLLDGITGLRITAISVKLPRTWEEHGSGLSFYWQLAGTLYVRRKVQE